MHQWLVKCTHTHTNILISTTIRQQCISPAAALTTAMQINARTENSLLNNINNSKT